jgi:hypothetical protein
VPGHLLSAYGAVLGGLFELLLCCPPPQLPELPRHAEAGSSPAGPSIELDEFEQPAMLSATSAARGRSVRMALSPTVVSTAGDCVGASSAGPRRRGKCVPSRLAYEGYWTPLCASVQATRRTVDTAGEARAPGTVGGPFRSPPAMWRRTPRQLRSRR